MYVVTFYDFLNHWHCPHAHFFTPFCVNYTTTTPQRGAAEEGYYGQNQREFGSDFDKKLVMQLQRHRYLALHFFLIPYH